MLRSLRNVPYVYFIIFEINGKWFARLFISADLMLFGGPNKARIVGKGHENKRIQEYRPSLERAMINHEDQHNDIQQLLSLLQDIWNHAAPGSSRKRQRVLAEPIIRW